MPLTDNELHAVLVRAEEIEAARGRSRELEAVLGAAEEVGLTRAAVEQALREKLGLPVVSPKTGDVVFAQSVDGKFYVADVLASAADRIRVRFAMGGEHDVAPENVRPASFVPGERVTVDWPMWGVWTCTVITYDGARKRAKLNDGWGFSRWFPIAEIWVEPARKTSVSAVRKRALRLMGAAAAVGALAGAALLALLARVL